jgi:hypothetical protein
MLAKFTVPILAATMLFSAVSSAKTRKDIPPAPLPEKLLTAHKVFVVNGGGSDLAFDAFYKALKDWGRFQLVSTPSDAEIVMQLRYGVVNRGTEVWSATNSYTGQTQVFSDQVVDPQLVLTVFDASSKTPLWSTVAHQRLARRQKNREKETVNAAEGLVERLKAKLSGPNNNQ